LIYHIVKANNLVDRNISVRPKRPGIGKVKGFRFPLTSNSCCNQEIDKMGRVEIKMPGKGLNDTEVLYYEGLKHKYAYLIATSTEDVLAWFGRDFA